LQLLDSLLAACRQTSGNLNACGRIELRGLLTAVTECPLEKAFLQWMGPAGRPAVGTHSQPGLGETFRSHAHLPIGPVLTVESIPWCSA